jgi:hypothetical protein
MVLLHRYCPFVPPVHALAFTQSFDGPSGPSNSPKIISTHPATFLPTASAHKPFSCNTCEIPRKCCKQKTYGKPKSFRRNTYEKRGWGSLSSTFGRSDVQTLRRPLRSLVAQTVFEPMRARSEVRTFRRFDVQTFRHSDVQTVLPHTPCPEMDSLVYSP